MLINVSGGKDMNIMDVNEAASLVMQAADSEANIIFGANIDEELKDEVRITVIATGFEKTEETPVTPGLKTPVSTVPAGTVSPAAAPAEEKTPHAEPPQPLEMEEPKPEENDPFEDIFKIFQNRD